MKEQGDNGAWEESGRKKLKWTKGKKKEKNEVWMNDCLGTKKGQSERKSGYKQEGM